MKDGRAEPKLKRIPVGTSSESGRISPRKRYRVLVDGRWLEGSFTKKWFGWCFEAPNESGLQMNLLDQVYEIVEERPKIRKPPGRR